MGQAPCHDAATPSAAVTGVPGTRRGAARPQPGPPPFARDWALFLDVDGTLLELADRPDGVVVRPDLIRLLGALQRAAGGAVALISGRAIADLDRLFAPLRLACAGQHGLERRDAGGRMHYHQPLDGRLDRMRTLLARLAEENPGVLIEDKGFSVAIHFREAPDREALVRDFLQRHMPRIERDFHLQQGKMVFEIKPGGRDKGMAIREFLQEAPFRGRVPVFIGDDVTDEDGFRIVNRNHGHSIKVAAGDTAAGWSLPDTGAVLHMLEAWSDFMQNHPQDR